MADRSNIWSPKLLWKMHSSEGRGRMFDLYGAVFNLAGTLLVFCTTLLNGVFVLWAWYKPVAAWLSHGKAKSPLYLYFLTAAVVVGPICLTCGFYWPEQTPFFHGRTVWCVAGCVFCVAATLAAIVSCSKGAADGPKGLSLVLKITLGVQAICLPLVLFLIPHEWGLDRF
jgi:hypothetical protein